MSVETCGDCGISYDNDRRYGRCPHVERDPDVIKQLEFNAAHPSYSSKHNHLFSGIEIVHTHYVLTGLEEDETYHHHPKIAERCERESLEKPLWPVVDGWAVVATEAG